MKFVKNKEIDSAILDNEVCLFESSKSKYYNLNSSGTHIWQILERPHTFEECFEKLSESFDFHDNDVKEELKSFLSSAVDKKIILKVE